MLNDNVELLANGIGGNMCFHVALVLSTLADSSFDAMSRRMDLGELPEWMAWERNHHWFALRAWGGITWRSLVQAAAASVLELIALGSCGAGAGKGLVEKILATIGETCNGKVFVVLKSLAGAEDFWSQQGFSTLSDSPEVQADYIAGGVRIAFRYYAAIFVERDLPCVRRLGQIAVYLLLLEQLFLSSLWPTVERGHRSRNYRRALYPIFAQ